MRKDYRKMQENILPGKETREWIWDSIEERAAESQKRHGQKRAAKWALGIAAAAAVCIFCIPQTGLAEGMRGFLRKFLFVEGGHITQQEVSHNVYEDCGEHVKMEIQEMLSDGACIYLNIRYSALDEEGKEWLSDYNFYGKDGWCDEIRFANVGDEFADRTRGTWWCGEGEDLATDTERYFTYFYRDGTGDFQAKDIERTIFYPMYQSQGIGKIMLKSNLEPICYRLVGEESPSKYYKPTYLIASKLSYVILGENQEGVYQKKTEDGYVDYAYVKGLEKEIEKMRGDFTQEDDEAEDMVYNAFLMEDGTKVRSDLNGSVMYPEPREWVKYWQTSDKKDTELDFQMLNLAIGFFTKDEDVTMENQNINVVIEPEKLAGLDINGVHYALEPCEFPEGY